MLKADRKKEDSETVRASHVSADASAQEDSSSEAETLTALARSAVETFVRERRQLEIRTTPAVSILQQKAACFVSIKTRSGDLRGCIGTIEPFKQTLAEELIANAISAATRDPRFLPVTEEELPHLRYSVDVLSEPEATIFEDLDPANYGVIVENQAGTLRGLLLPDIEGIDTARQQVEIAARKAGIAPGTPLRFFRFRVRRFREPARFHQNREQGAEQ